MRIAYVDYVCDPARPGRTGLSDLVWDMAGRLAHMGHEVHVIGPYTTDVFPNPTVCVHRFRLPPIGYRNIIGHFLIILRAYQTLRVLGPVDVIHTPEYTSAAVIASLNRTPLVFTEPGNIYERLRYGNPYDGLTTQVYKAAARITARRCSHCLATSEWMKGWWLWTGVSPDRITLIPLGVDTRLFRPRPEANKALGLPAGRPHLVFAARLSRESGAEVTLRAVARLKADWPDVQLSILGNGLEQGVLRQLARQLGLDNNVIWRGWVDMTDLPLYYSSADVFVFSGFSGGTPRVLLQALACGAPVVASAIGGIVDHVQNNETGMLFRAGNVEEMASCLHVLLANPALAHKIGQAGRDYVHHNLSWDVLCYRIQEVYMVMMRQQMNQMEQKKG